MASHISRLMLDSMFTAVDGGFSYDGIISAPGIGLEDRPRLTVLLHDGFGSDGKSSHLAQGSHVGRWSVVLHRRSQDQAGLPHALSETAVEVSTRLVEENLARVPENAFRLHTAAQRTQGHGAADDEEGLGIQSFEAPLHTKSHVLPVRQEPVMQPTQLAIGLAGDNGTELDVRFSITPLSTEPRNPPVRLETAAQPTQIMIRSVGDDEDIQSAIPPSHEHHDHSVWPTAGIHEGSTNEKNFDEHLHVKQSGTRALLIVATCTAAMIINASNITSVLISLPEIGRANDIREDQLQWLLSAYSLSTGCLFLYYEHLADVFGRKLVFTSGMIWQASFAFGCGFSNNRVTLYVLRGFQGVGAAAAIPSALGLLADTLPVTFPGPVAFMIVAAGTPIGSALGIITGGIFTEFTKENWRSPFFLAAASSILILAAGQISFTGDKPSSRANRRVDFIGAMLLTCGLVLTVFALSQGPIVGWKTPYIIATLVVGVSLVGIFLLWERHLEKALDKPEDSERQSFWAPPPLMKLSLWARSRGQMSVILAIIFLNWCSFTCWFFWALLYYRRYLQLSPTNTIVRFIPMFVVDVLGVFFNSILTAKVPLVALLATGALSTGAACMLFALIDPSVTYWTFSFSSTLLAVFGSNIVHYASALFISKIKKSGDQHLLHPMARIGNVFGLVISTIAFNGAVNEQSAKLGVVVNATGSNVPTSAALKGYRVAQWTGAGFSFLAALLAVVFLRGVGVVGVRIFSIWSTIRRLVRRWRRDR